MNITGTRSQISAIVEMANQQTVVIELGSSLLRVGIAGESVPRYIVSMSVFPELRKCHDKTLGAGRIRRLYAEFFQSIFNEYLQVKSRDCRVLIIEKLLSPRLQRNSLLTALLKDIQVINFLASLGIVDTENENMSVLEVIELKQILMVTPVDFTEGYLSIPAAGYLTSYIDGS